MVWSALASLVAVILDLLTARHQPEGAKDLESVASRACGYRVGSDSR